MNEQLRPCYDFFAKARNRTTEAYTGHGELRISSYFNEICDLICSSLETTSEKIGGEGMTVGIEESKFCKVEDNRGHKADGVEK